MLQSALSPMQNLNQHSFLLQVFYNAGFTHSLDPYPLHFLLNPQQMCLLALHCKGHAELPHFCPRHVPGLQLGLHQGGLAPN